MKVIIRSGKLYHLECYDNDGEETWDVVDAAPPELCMECGKTFEEEEDDPSDIGETYYNQEEV